MLSKEEIFYRYASLKNENFPLLSFKKLPEDFIGKRPCKSHIRGQFVFPQNGTVKVYANSVYYLIPPKQTIWIPPGAEHEMICPPESYPITFSLINTSQSSRFISRVAIFNQTPLLFELVSKSVNFKPDYSVDSPEFRLTLLLIDELLNLQEAKLHLPLVKDARLLRITKVLTNEPKEKHGIAELSKIACMTPRSMNRLFEKETSMTLNEWVRQQKVLQAIEKLEKKQSVSIISAELGYRSISAFIETFKKATGKSPGKFFTEKTRRAR